MRAQPIIVMVEQAERDQFIQKDDGGLVLHPQAERDVLKFREFAAILRRDAP
jgi:hypothetical protein